jgi:hypothetical protein
VWNHTDVPLQVVRVSGDDERAAMDWSPLRPGHKRGVFTDLAWRYELSMLRGAAGAEPLLIGTWPVTEHKAQQVFAEMDAAGRPSVQAIVCQEMDPRFEEHRVTCICGYVDQLRAAGRPVTARSIVEVGDLPSSAHLPPVVVALRVVFSQNPPGKEATVCSLHIAERKDYRCLIQPRVWWHRRLKKAPLQECWCCSR